MKISAEARLWWLDASCKAVEHWFEKLSKLNPGGVPSFDGASLPEPRRDDYVRDLSQPELGIKLRDAGTPEAHVEVKSLVKRCCEVTPFGPVTIWTKNSSSALVVDSIQTVITYKWRRLRKFVWTGDDLTETVLDENEKVRDGAQPNAGCNLEFTRVTIDASQQIWWTLGYEAFGQLEEVESILQTCLRKTASLTPLPTADRGQPATYPEWLMLVG